MKTATVWNEDEDLLSFFLPHRGAFGSWSFPPYTKNLPSNAKNGPKKMLMPGRGVGVAGVVGAAGFVWCVMFYLLRYVNCSVVRIFFLHRFPMFDK